MTKRPANHDIAFQWICFVAMAVSIPAIAWHSGAPTTLAAGAVFVGALFVLRFTSFSKFKLGGVLEIEQAAREAHQAAEEAKATVVQLRTLAATVGKLSLDQLGLRGRLGVIPPRKLVAMRDTVAQALGVAGCSKEEVAQAKHLLDLSVRFDLARRIPDIAWELARHEPATRGVAEEVAEQCKKLFGAGFAVTGPAEFRNVLSRIQNVPSEVTKCLDDYEHYDRTGEPPAAGETDFFDGLPL